MRDDVYTTDDCYYVSTSVFPSVRTHVENFISNVCRTGFVVVARVVVTGTRPSEGVLNTTMTKWTLLVTIFVMISTTSEVAIEIEETKSTMIMGVMIVTT